MCVYQNFQKMISSAKLWDSIFFDTLFIYLLFSWDMYIVCTILFYKLQKIIMSIHLKFLYIYNIFPTTHSFSKDGTCHFSIVFIECVSLNTSDYEVPRKVLMVVFIRKVPILQFHIMEHFLWSKWFSVSKCKNKPVVAHKRAIWLGFEIIHDCK